MNKRYKKKKYYNNFLMMAIILIIGFLSVGYSAFSEDLVMRDIAVNVRVDANVRVTNFSAMSIENGALSNYEEYNVNNVTSSINLPNSDSSIRYKVEVTNFGNVDMGIFTITGLPSNLVYDVVDYEFKDKICNSSNSCTLGAKKEFYIDVMYIENGFDSNNTTYNLKLDFDFRQIYSVKYEGITNNNYPDSIMHGDILKVNFTDSVPPKVVPYINGLKSKNYTFINNQFTMENVISDVTLKYIDKVYLHYVDGDSKAFFHEADYETKIKNVKFVDYVDTSNALVTYDLSEEQNNEIIGWVDSNYTLYIGSDWNIYGKNLSYIFNQMSEIRTISFNNLNTSESTNMSYMFYGLKYITELNLSGFNTSNVTNMLSMFEGCKELENLNLNNFNTSKVTNMSRMFYETGYNVPEFDISAIASWDVSKVTTMANMFEYTGYSAKNFNLGDLSNWNTASLTTMYHMFTYTGYNAAEFNLGNLGSWNTSKVTNMSTLFSSSGYKSGIWYVGDLSNWDTSKVTVMHVMFSSTAYNASEFDVGDLGKWDISSVKNIYSMFNHSGYSATTWYVGDLSNWDTSSVSATMQAMFTSAGHSDETWSVGDLSTKTVVREDGSTYVAWDVSGAVNMSSMFQGAGAATNDFNIGNIGTWNVSNVESMKDMFYGAGGDCTTWYIGDLSNWNIGKVTDISRMFAYTAMYATDFDIGDISGWNTSKVTDMSLLFHDTAYRSSKFDIGNIGGWNVSNVTNMKDMFSYSGYSADYWYIGDISTWNTSNVEDMTSMFSTTGYNASYSLDLSSWQVPKVTAYVDFNKNVEDKITPPVWV